MLAIAWVLSSVLEIPAVILLSHFITLGATEEYLAGVVIFIILVFIATRVFSFAASKKAGSN